VELQYRIQNHLLSSKKIDTSGELVKDIKFSDIRNALIATIRLISKPSLFELNKDEDDYEYRTVSQAELNYEMLKALKALQTTTTTNKQPGILAPPPYVASAVPLNPFAQRQSYSTIYYNCAQLGHTSNICLEPRVSDQQYRDNKLRIDAAKIQRVNANTAPRPEVPVNHTSIGYQPPPLQRWTSHQFNPTHQPLQSNPQTPSSTGSSSIGAEQPRMTKEAPVNPVLLCRDPLTRIVEKLANPVGIEKQANPVERTRPRTDRPTTRASASGAPHEPPRADKGKNQAVKEI
jgi:hypothetical protein